MYDKPKFGSKAFELKILLNDIFDSVCLFKLEILVFNRSLLFFSFKSIFFMNELFENLELIREQNHLATSRSYNKK